ncbi:hypothetical protein [Pedobacter heparinus]|uniref:hypothetical protein n=1 Tax=Pedobacter heparinus TaxID=984 RepID=UPI00292E577B|nr:hypothetical protein [Pedobacter heparinus]
MNRSKKHTPIYKQALVLLIGLCCLFPCSVKKAFISTFDVAFSSPINKTNAANFNLGCSDFRIGKKCSSLRVKAEQRFTIADLSYNTRLNASGTYGDKLQPKNCFRPTGNSPPKYILYKRLKLHLA